MIDTIEVKGLSELKRNLEHISKISMVNAGVSMNRAGAYVFQKAAKENVHSVSGTLAKAIKIKRLKSPYGMFLHWVGIKTKGEGKAPHAHLVEYGTSPHIIKGKNGPMFIAGGNKPIWKVEHPGSRPHPFMRKAFEENVEKAIQRMGRSLARSLEKWKSKVASGEVIPDES